MPDIVVYKPVWHRMESRLLGLTTQKMGIHLGVGWWVEWTNQCVGQQKKHIYRVQIQESNSTQKHWQMSRPVCPTICSLVEGGRDAVFL